ncbi:MAG: sigma-70 family RNA polymerase sigma factor [Acidobacteria bacterium]|nr:sigma-70 family RNA polymerase sigma factor [Acidobacteriota bacterium]
MAPTMMQTEGRQALEAQAAASDSELIETHMRRVFRLIYRVVGNVPDAQDLTQDAFVKALKRREQLKDPEKAAQWLGRIAVNTALDFMRRNKRVRFEEIDVAPESPSESPEQTVLRDEKRRYIEDGLRLLSDRERAALILRDIEGLPAVEVAARLNCSPATVRSHIANARVKFKKYVQGRRG